MEEFAPILIHFGRYIDLLYKTLDKLFLTSKFNTRIDSLINGRKNGFILAAGLLIFGYKHKDVVNIYLYLFDQFNLENYVIIDSFFVTISTFSIFLIQVNINALIVLKIPFR